MGHELAVRGRGATAGVEPIDGLGGEQGLERGDQRDREGGPGDGRVADLGEVGRVEEAEHAAEALGHGQLDAVRGLDHPGLAERGEARHAGDPEGHHGQRGGDAAGPRHAPAVPDPDQGQRGQADRHRAGMEGTDDLEQLREGVLAVGLEKRHLPFVVGVAAEEMGDLLEDQDHADRGEKPSDHARGHERLDEAPLGQAERDLDQPGEHHGQEQRLEGTERGDLGGHHGHEPGGRAGDHHLCAAQPAHDHSGHHPGDHTGDGRGPGGQRDPQAERQGHKKRDQPGHQIGRDMLSLEGRMADEIVIEVGLGHRRVPWSWRPGIVPSRLRGPSGRPAGSFRRESRQRRDRAVLDLPAVAGRGFWGRGSPDPPGRPSTSTSIEPSSTR